jgi:hypothetical protein
MSEETEAARKPGTAAGWKKSAVHTVTLPSGFVAKIRIPDLPALIESGAIPQGLTDVAISVASGMKPERPTADLIAQQRKFTDVLVMKAVVEPALSEDDLSDIPFEDKEMIVEISTRQIDFDAEGHHLAGLEKSAKFRQFRRIGEFDPSLAGL